MASGLNNLPRAWRPAEQQVLTITSLQKHTCVQTVMVAKSVGLPGEDLDAASVLTVEEGQAAPSTGKTRCRLSERLG